MTHLRNIAQLNLNVTSPESEFSRDFLQGMLNRMAVSYHKYGAVKDAYPRRVNAIESLHQRLAKYAETGNTEFLMDAANFAMIEFMHPAHPEATFRATDSDESPGRTFKDGSVSQAGNLSDQEKTARERAAFLRQFR